MTEELLWRELEDLRRDFELERTVLRYLLVRLARGEDPEYAANEIFKYELERLAAAE